MGLRQSQLNDILKANATASNDAWAGAEKRKQDSAMQKAQQDAALSQLIKGKELDAQAKNDMLTRQLGEARSMRGEFGPEASINVEGVSIGARDPLQTLLRKKELSKPSLTPGQEAADKTFGKEYSDFVAGGGVETANKNLRGLQDVQAKLKNAPEPNLLQRAAGYLPDSFRAAITPEAKAREDEVKSAIQNTLRQTLGAQFTEKEGTAILNRAYDPRLTNAENLRRVQREAAALKAQLEQKMRSAQQFENTGSLVGLGAAGGSNAPMQQQMQRAQQGQPSNDVEPPKGTPEHFQWWRRQKGTAR